MGRPRKNPVTETGVETQIGIEDAVPKSTALESVRHKALLYDMHFLKKLSKHLQKFLSLLQRG